MAGQRQHATERPWARYSSRPADPFVEARMLDRQTARVQIARLVERVERGDELQFGFVGRGEEEVR